MNTIFLIIIVDYIKKLFISRKHLALYVTYLIESNFILDCSTKLIACHSAVRAINYEEIEKEFYPEAFLKITLKVHIITFSFLTSILQR